MALAPAAAPSRSVQALGTTRRRFPLCAGHIRPRSAAAGSPRAYTLHVAASVPLLVCATALAATPARAQQATLPPTPPGDSAAAASAGAVQGGRVAAPPPAYPVDSSAFARPTVPLPADPADSVGGPAAVGRPGKGTGTMPAATGIPVDSPRSTAVTLPTLPGDSARAAARGLVLVAVRKLAQRAQRSRHEPRTAGEYYRAAFGPGALLRAGAVAGFGQLLDRPHWLPRNRAGYAARFGLELGTNALAAGIRYETGRWLGVRSVEFEPCACQGTAPRLLHALAGPFRAETPDGDRFSPFTPLTHLSSAMLFASVNGGLRPRQGLEAGLTGLLSMSVVDVLLEFRPWEKWLGH